MLYATDFLGNDPRFLYYLLTTIDFAGYNSGSAQPSLNRNFIASIEVRCPPFAEQRAIAAVLGALDDKIEVNRAMARTLDEMARALYTSWFVDFDPVHAKAEGRDPGLPAEIADLFPDSFEDSALGPIPAGWSVEPLEKIGALTRATVQPKKSPSRSFRHYSIPAFDEAHRPIDEEGSRIKSGKYAVPPNAVLLSKLNPSTPRVWCVGPAPGEDAICSTEFLPFVAQDARLTPHLYELLRSESFGQIVSARVTGSTGSRQRARPDDVVGIEVLVAPDALQSTFSDTAAPLHQRSLATVDENATLAELRDTLLPKLVSGAVRIPDPEGFLEKLEAVS